MIVPDASDLPWKMHTKRMQQMICGRYLMGPEVRLVYAFFIMVVQIFFG